MLPSLLTVLLTVSILGALLSNRTPPTQFSETVRTLRDCRKRFFRTLSGQCTSTTDPTWGAAGAPYFSYILNHSSVIPTGQNRKNARLISNLLSAQSTDTVNAHGLNELWPSFALFLAHDVIDTPFNGPPMPIITPPDDPFLPPGIPIFFRRSQRVRTGEGDNEEPVNTVSSAVDLSGVYGIDKERNMAVRVPGSAKLRTSPGNLLPLNTDGLPNVPDNSPHFYFAGDPRANETPLLLIFHILFLREHNRLVDKIHAKIPYAPVEVLFELARSINIAQFQKIVFEEFYAALVGTKLPLYRGFRKRVNPSISNIFASSAGAIGINMLGNTVPRKAKDGSSLPSITLAESVNRNATEHPLTPEEVDNFIRGSVSTFSQENDLQMHDGLRSVLIETPIGKIGFDLMAIILMRGRDQAIPTFNELRKILGLKPVTFETFSSDPKVVAALKKAYDNVDDVETWVGLVGEDKMPGSGVGATAALAWRREFMRLRDGDQFFYRRKFKMPHILHHLLRKLLRDLHSKKKKLLRKIIIRNTGVKGKYLYKKDIFRIKA